MHGSWLPRLWKALIKGQKQRARPPRAAVRPTLEALEDRTLLSGPATHFAIIGSPIPATVGTPFSFTVEALDSSNNLATSYSGSLKFTSSDTQAVVPTNVHLTSGLGTFSATLETLGSQTLSVFGPTLNGLNIVAPTTTTV